MAVSTTNALYNKYLPYVQQNRVVLEGTKSIIENAKKYIPKPSALDENEYLAMVKRPSFDNILERVLDTFVGLAFANPPIKEVPSKTEKQIQEIDLSDNTDVDMSQRLVKEVFISGRVGVLVDLNNTLQYETTNALMVEQMGIRPYATIYPTESIINYRIENNQVVLVVLKEEVEEWINKFETETVTQYRVLEIDETGYYKQTIMQEDSNHNDVVISEIYPTQNGQKMRWIPFYACNSQTLDIKPVKPPLSDMADSNLSMHRLKIDLYHALYFTIPTPYGKGIQDDESPSIVLGSTQLHVFRNPDAGLEYLEFKGEGLTHISNEIQNCKDTMGTLGAEFLRDSSSKNEAMETVAMRLAGDRASLISIIDTVSRIMVKVLSEMARWNGEDDKNITYQINTDFDLTTIDTNLIKVMIDGVQMNQIPQKVLHHNLKQNDLLPEELEDYESFQGALETAPIDLSIPTNNETREDNTTLISSIRNRLGI